jgi:hypothetical protein
MEALIRAGESREQAAKRVASVLKQIGYPFPRNSTQWRTVAELRDEIHRSLSDKGRKSEFYDFYWLDQVCLDRAIGEEGKDPAVLAKEYLYWLSAMRL